MDLLDRSLFGGDREMVVTCVTNAALRCVVTPALHYRQIPNSVPPNTRCTNYFELWINTTGIKILV